MKKTDLTPFDADYSRFIQAGEPWSGIFEDIMTGDLPKKSFGKAIIDESELELIDFERLFHEAKVPNIKKESRLGNVLAPVLRTELRTDWDKRAYWYTAYIKVDDPFSVWTNAHLLFKVEDGGYVPDGLPTLTEEGYPNYNAVIPAHFNRLHYSHSEPDLNLWYRKAYVCSELKKIVERRIALKFEKQYFPPENLLLLIKTLIALGEGWGVEREFERSDRPLNFVRKGDRALITPMYQEIIDEENPLIIEL